MKSPGFVPTTICHYNFTRTQYSLYFVKLFKFKTATMGIAAFSIFSMLESETL
jgi:hypothetical protein